MKNEEQRRHDNILVWCGFMFLITLLVGFTTAAKAQSSQQSGTACVNGTQYCENSNVYTTNETTTNNQNVNQNTNVNTSTSQNTNVNTSTVQNTNINNSTAQNTNINTSTSVSTSNSTAQNTNINQNTSVSNSTVNSTVNQTVNNNNVSQSTSNSVSQNTNINKSESESKVETSNLNQNMNNTVSDNTNRNINESNSTQTIRQEVRSKAPPASAIAPSIMSYSQDICRVGQSAAFSGQVIGLSGGKTVIDENCERLKLSQMLYNQGMKVAAISLLAQDARVFKAMWAAGTPAPYEGKIGEEAKKLWLANPQKRPDKEDFEAEFLQSCTQERNPNREKIKADVVGFVSKVVVSKKKSKAQCKKELYGG
jgi:hypothetical protein